jgi:hypothetical protein
MDLCAAPGARSAANLRVFLSNSYHAKPLGIVRPRKNSPDGRTFIRPFGAGTAHPVVLQRWCTTSIRSQSLERADGPVTTPVASNYDSEIVLIAAPALASILVDSGMLLIDTGAPLLQFRGSASFPPATGTEQLETVQAA